MVGWSTVFGETVEYQEEEVDASRAFPLPCCLNLGRTRDSMVEQKCSLKGMMYANDDDDDEDYRRPAYKLALGWDSTKTETNISSYAMRRRRMAIYLIFFSPPFHTFSFQLAWIISFVLAG
jgi:hypothetical protein